MTTEASTLTREEQESGDKVFNEKMSEFSERAVAIRTKIFQGRWRMGAFVEDLVRNPQQFAGKTLEDVALRLGDTAENLMLSHLFYRTYSADEVVALGARQLNWDRFKHLVRIGPADVRAALVDRVEREIADPLVVRKIVDKMLGVSRKPRGARGENF